MKLITDNTPVLVLVLSLEHWLGRSLRLVEFLLQNLDCGIAFLGDRSIFHEFLLEFCISPRQSRGFGFLGCKDLGMCPLQCGIRFFKLDILVPERGNGTTQRPQIRLRIFLRQGREGGGR